jgi:L-serine/L-threonine ammonia-lyase
MIRELKTLGAIVHQYGADWLEADSYMRAELLSKDSNGIYVPPFDHEYIWEGNATLIDEIDEQVGDYDGVVCSVGGGGIVCGVMEGLAKRRQHRDKPIRVLAMEIEGADSFHQSAKTGRHITLPRITSTAAGLGATKVAEKAFRWLLMYQGGINTLALSDAEAAFGSVSFAEDERMLIEISCGVSIATAYGRQLRQEFGSRMSEAEWAAKRIVIIVCGGNNVTLELMDIHREKYAGRPTMLNRTVEVWNKADKPALCSHTPFLDNYEQGWNGPAQTTMKGHQALVSHVVGDLENCATVLENEPVYETQFDEQFEQHVREQVNHQEYRWHFERLQIAE